MSDSIKVWDAPLRLFHWSLALAVGGAMLTGWLGGNLMVWHGRLGLSILGLLAFRLLWGMLGSTYARWSRIFAAPLRLGDYLAGRWREAGHNPLGSLSVLALLGLAAFQTLSGLAANDDIAFQGPLYRLVETDTSTWLTALHRQAWWLLLGLIGLHLLAILYYSLVRRQPLVRAMVGGRSPRRYPEQHEASGGAPWALGVALAGALLLVWGVQSAAGWLAPPAAPAAPAALDW
ncbi:Nickel-dependent hydrogenase b-type cytochrome subunit [Azotobacter vinelandii CA]|uniref:Nickel-dependent hydrogenase b-type cytochrome subunit n=2 Tax=Azotobacter vinelandii TaxID=354 RepID=C1DKA4_AZOVD|nr:cytochrome b/b6 domain-containing protein [Azotobacter vinelandii]ACO81009.1 Nickel-dependent hydrogenase b-type cytochrome subunit [Azotobacter vinelandii DJ]AGK15826.1 Nickel-dependent hydrogenase b-type cytochrome subunit [Azotobacter vinelandii CA]AGK22289.1 Nickel-dependent hydrogenase b-type cytochrome subunit [Azotobacter vinelandii CA6]WKN21790.1 cytochrome b/b6 domain-containing protein [Azotobacter vinelandii]SFW98467.1 Cytochrome b [Azotobacter vinelandii]